MKRFRLVFEYHDHRTGESWNDSEYCYADDIEAARQDGYRRLKHSATGRLVGIDEA